MTNRSTNTLQERGLPDLECSVCAQKGHGLHFGVVTCRACASFFRRSIVQKKSYKCLRGGNKCDIRIEGARKACRACRLQICHQVGMRFDEDEKSASGSGDESSKPQKVTASNSSKTPGNSDTMDIVPVPDITDNRTPFLAKFIRGYDAFIASQRSAFIVQHPNLVFQNIAMIAPSKEELARINEEAHPLLFSMLNEYVEPFAQLVQDLKMLLLDECKFQFLILHRIYLTVQNFPGLDDKRSVLGIGYFVDSGRQDEFLRYLAPDGIDVEEYIRIKKPMMDKMDRYFTRFKMLQDVQEQDFCAMMVMVLWNEAERLDCLNEDMRLHKELVLIEWLSNLTARLGNAQAANMQMARLLCLMVELNSLSLYNKELMTVLQLLRPNFQDNSIPR